jgi:hypothetical protein
MPDILLDGIPVIDLLEITPSTQEVALQIQRDQSSVSRIYRQVSTRLGLNFAKQPDGQYRALANHALLQELRRSSQQLRIHQKPEELRWVGSPWNGAIQTRTSDRHPPALERHWFGERRTLVLLDQHMLDLAVVPVLDLLPKGPLNTASLRQAQPLALGNLVALPLVHYDLAVTTHPRHPLQQATDLGPDRFAAYPSLAANPADFPHTSSALRRLGLWRTPHAITSYSWQQWEGSCSDQRHLVVTHPIGRAWLQPHLELAPLPHTTGIVDADVILVRADLLSHEAIAHLIQAIQQAYREHYRHLTDLRWLL